MTVEIRAQHKHRTILFGSLYDDIGLCEPTKGFLGASNWVAEYDPEVSRDETEEDGYEE